jgi:filamentous hemagglutinin
VAKSAEAKKKDLINVAENDIKAQGQQAWDDYSKATPKDKEALRSKANADYKNAADTLTNWGAGGDYTRALSAVTSIVVGGVAGQGGAQIAGNALAPYAASLIGQQFDHTDDPNKAAQLLSHAVLGATLAYLNGGNAAAGAAAGAGSEAAAQYLTKELYPEAFDANGTFDRTKLTEAQANHIIGLGAGIGALVGGTTGGSVFDGAVGGEVGRNAVENNQVDESPTTQLGALFCKVLGQGKCSDGAAAQEQKLETEKRMMALNPIKAGAIKQAISLGADFAPIIGDIKGFAEAETVGDYIFATVAVVPVVGDAIKSARTAYKTAKAAGDVKGMKNALEDVAQACSGGYCFEAGTLVQTENGLQAIETFVGGELVWSRDEVTGAMAYKPVIATKVTADQAIYRITVQNQKGQIETFGTTSEHPFWVKDWGWIKASLLQAGTELVDGQNQTLRITHAELTDETATVYNIEVEDYHTYHVGEIGVWVHNANCCSVYTSTNPVTGATQYVGITNNLARREAEHLRTKGIEIEKLLDNLSRSDAKAVEQALIEIHGLGKNGGLLMNRINSISRTNPSYANQLRRGYEFLQTLGVR